MSKQKAKQQAKELGISIDKIIPEKFQTPILLLFLLILILIFFSPITFGDKTLSSADLIQVKSLREYANKERDGFSLWNPHIFCGMPAIVTSTAPRMFDLTAAIYSYASRIYSSAFKDYNAIYTFSFVILAFASFFMMRSLGANRLLSFLVSASLIFSTGITVLFYIGHITKLMSLSILPFILMMLFKFQKEIKLIDVLLFTLGMHLLVLNAHVQIVFYFALLAAIYFIYFTIYSVVKKNIELRNNILKSLGITVAVGIIALLMSFDTYSQILEYKPYSTRGTKSITETHNTNTPAQNNSYEYATNWSFSPEEVMTFIIPSYYGFGKSTYKGELTQNQEVEVNTYFGQMPFVDTAMYMGIIVFALALFALVTRRKEPLVQFLGIIVLLFLILSFGKNFPLLYNLFYYYFPQFDNFRAPSMILHVLQIVFPILAGLGLMKIIQLKEENNFSINKTVKILFFTFSGLFIISILANDSLKSWFSNRVLNYSSTLGNQQEAQMFNALSDYMSNMFAGDLQIALVLLALTFGIVYIYLTKKINKELLIIGVIVFSLFDLFRISSRGASYIDKSQIDQLFTEPNYVRVIKQQNESSPFRILNLKRQGMGSVSQNSNFNVYFLLEDFYGYSAVKPRSYQDIMDVVGPVNTTLWKMLGVKYIVTEQPYGVDGFTLVNQIENEFVYKNEKALPRVYFVDKVEKKSGKEILELIKNDSFEPSKIAFVEEKDFDFSLDTSATSTIKKYSDEKISIETKSNGKGFLFFGTTYLPAWKAYIDGVETKTYKTNYGFIGVIIPEGNHNVEFSYEPKGFAIGKMISLSLNILLFAGIIALVLGKRKNKS
ncbi:MAG: YfhO family protein [Melioribacteraceae bacterium]|nr:YfhO family protein [Melioribacteraceae bacterium]